MGNLFFFSGGERREGKSSFAVFGFAVGRADCKCAFSFGVGISVLFLNVVFVAIKRWEIYSFFSVGKMGKGKALLQTWLLVLV